MTCLLLATSRSIAALLAQASFPDRTGIFGNPRLGELVPRSLTRVEQQRHPQAVARPTLARPASGRPRCNQQRLSGEPLTDDAWLSTLDPYSVIFTNPCWTSSRVERRVRGCHGWVGEEVERAEE
jgi:hypothetical protein